MTHDTPPAAVPVSHTTPEPPEGSRTIGRVTRQGRPQARGSWTPAQGMWGGGGDTGESQGQGQGQGQEVHCQQ
jgi:hypothetical protein